MIRQLDRRTVLSEAAVILAVLGPPVLLVNAISGNDDESYLWLLPALAIFVAFAVGGWRAARRQPRTPFIHATAAAVTALVAARLVSIVVDLAQGDGFSFPPAFVLLAQVAVSISLLSAYLASRRPARTT